MNDSVEQYFFRGIAARAQGETFADVDVVEVGNALLLSGADIFMLLNDLIERGLVTESPDVTWGKLNVRLTRLGSDRYAQMDTNSEGSDDG